MNYDFSLFYQYNDEMEVYLNQDEEFWIFEYVVK